MSEIQEPANNGTFQEVSEAVIKSLNDANEVPEADPPSRKENREKTNNNKLNKSRFKPQEEAVNMSNNHGNSMNMGMPQQQYDMQGQQYYDPMMNQQNQQMDPNNQYYQNYQNPQYTDPNMQGGGYYDYGQPGMEQQNPYGMQPDYYGMQQQDPIMEEPGEEEEFPPFDFGALGLPQLGIPYEEIQEQTNTKTVQQLREMRLIEALDKQTALLESIAQNYHRNKELRTKADLRKLKNKLERLENEKLFKDLQYHQARIANDIANNNNQMIFNHLNAQAQLKANPIVLSVTGRDEMPDPRGLRLPMSMPMSMPSMPMPNTMPNRLVSGMGPLPFPSKKGFLPPIANPGGFGFNPNPFGPNSFPPPPFGGRPGMLPPLGGGGFGGGFGGFPMDLNMKKKHKSSSKNTPSKKSKKVDVDLDNLISKYKSK
jgi:hypothetical protein